MSNKAKRNIFLTLLILELIACVPVAIFTSEMDANAKWWIYFSAAILFVVFFGGYRNFSQAVDEDERFG